MTYFLVPRATVVRVEGVPRLKYVESTYRLSKQYKEHIPSTSTTATASATTTNGKFVWDIARIAGRSCCGRIFRHEYNWNSTRLV